MTTRDALHQLVDQLDDSELGFAEFLLDQRRSLSRDGVLRRLAAIPVDDEPETDEEAEAIREAREDVAAGRLIPHEEVRRRLLQLP